MCEFILFFLVQCAQLVYTYVHTVYMCIRMYVVAFLVLLFDTVCVKHSTYDRHILHTVHCIVVLYIYRCTH